MKRVGGAGLSVSQADVRKKMGREVQGVLGNRSLASRDAAGAAEAPCGSWLGGCWAGLWRADTSQIVRAAHGASLGLLVLF